MLVPLGSGREEIRTGQRGEEPIQDRVVGPELGVKASGGVKDQPTALRMIEAGATRIGASAGVRIVHGNGAGPERPYGSEVPATITAEAPALVASTVIPAPRATIHRLG